jgi:LemA protein
MKKLIAAIVLLGFVAIVIGGAYVRRRNEVAIKDQAVAAQWRQVDTFLQRRLDLIPNLLDVVKTGPAQDETAARDIAKARLAMIAAQTPSTRIAANTDLDGALDRWIAIVGKERELKSNENFLLLQDQLAGTENRIAIEGRRYDELVRDYNDYISVFPNDIFARWAGFQPKTAYFAAPATPQK